MFNTFCTVSNHLSWHGIEENFIGAFNLIIADEEESRNDSWGSVLVGDWRSEPAKLLSFMLRDRSSTFVQVQF
jgi:hypothetical protein